MKFYKRFPGDINIKTGHLTPAQMGCYDRLLDHYYATETLIPLEGAYSICRAVTKADRDACDLVLSQFFEKTAQGWRQSRAAEEIAEAQPKIEAARANGKKGGRPKEKPSGFPLGSKSESQTADSAKASQSQMSSPTSKTISKASPSHPPAGGFTEFWLAWPKNDRKQDKSKCAELWAAKGLDAVADEILADVRAKRGTRKWGDGFIEAPLVYLRNKRWEDGNTEPADEDIGDWRASRTGIEAMGEKLGLGRWDEAAFNAAASPAEAQERGFKRYEQRVERAYSEQQEIPA